MSMRITSTSECQMDFLPPTGQSRGRSTPIPFNQAVFTSYKLFTPDDIYCISRHHEGLLWFLPRIDHASIEYAGFGVARTLQRKPTTLGSHPFPREAYELLNNGPHQPASAVHELRIVRYSLLVIFNPLYPPFRLFSNKILEGGNHEVPQFVIAKATSSPAGFSPMRCGNPFPSYCYVIEDNEFTLATE